MADYRAEILSGDDYQLAQGTRSRTVIEIYKSSSGASLTATQIEALITPFFMRVRDTNGNRVTGKVVEAVINPATNTVVDLQVKDA